VEGSVEEGATIARQAGRRLAAEVALR